MPDTDDERGWWCAYTDTWWYVAAWYAFGLRWFRVRDQWVRHYPGAS
jgi:hypothetical protein